MSLFSDRTKIYAHDNLDDSAAIYRSQRGGGSYYSRRSQGRTFTLDPYANQTTSQQFIPANITTRLPNPDVRPKTRRQHFSNAVFVTAKSNNPRRVGGVRRFPATPAEPSLLNIENLNNPSVGGDQNISTRARHMLGVDLVNFPRLETSPTRMKLLMQSVGKLRGRVGIDTSAPPVQPRSQRQTGSRSLDDSMTFEEAIIAGRGTRQLPVIGPQQLLQGSHGRGRGGGGRRELPRPGTSVDLSMNTGCLQQATNGIPIPPATSVSAYMESEDDEEEWC